MKSTEFFKLMLDNQDFLLDAPDEISLEPDVIHPRERAVLATEGILGWDQFEDVIKHGVGHSLHSCSSY